jgi:spore coat polysaccharide biosynthesis protein SpsF (cytidylyltransferase family)
MSELRVLAVVQARLASTRLPGKALLDLAGRPMLTHVLARAAAVPGVDRVVLATTVSPDDVALADLARAAGFACVRGSVDDVLDRFHAALAAHPAAAVVRITADCPLLDPEVSGRVVSEYRRRAGELDYVSNVHPPTYPDGLDTEVIGASALERAWREASPGSDREHVTPYVWGRPERFRLANVCGAEDLSGYRWTVDDARDLDFVRAVYRRLAPGREPARPFGMNEVLDLVRACPEIAELNAGTLRNEGFERSRLADLASKGPAA